MWLVSIALRRPYTFVVMAGLIVLLGISTVRRMSTDILPEIDIPVVAVVWSYGGLPPEEMEKRIVGNFERFLTLRAGPCRSPRRARARRAWARAARSGSCRG